MGCKSIGIITIHSILSEEGRTVLQVLKVRRNDMRIINKKELTLKKIEKEEKTPKAFRKRIKNELLTTLFFYSLNPDIHHTIDDHEGFSIFLRVPWHFFILLFSNFLFFFLSVAVFNYL